MSRAADNIRKIAHTKELRDKLIEVEQKAEQALKAAIAAQRGLAYLDPGAGNVGNSDSGIPGVTKPNNHGSGYAKPETTVDNPGEDKKLKLKDCDTGEDIDVNLDTGDNEGEALFPGPDGWNAGVPPLAEDWFAGFYWNITNSPGIYNTPYPANPIVFAMAMQANNRGPRIRGNGIIGTIYGPNSFGDYIKIKDFYVSTPTVYEFTAVGCDADGNEFGSPGIIGTIVQVACGVIGPFPTGSGCELVDAPRQNIWPDGTNHQIAYSKQLGGFVTSRYDPYIPPQFNFPWDDLTKVPPSQIHLCNQDDQPVGVKVLNNGTFAYFNDDGTGEPDTDYEIRNYSSSGDLIGTLTLDDYNSLSE